MYHTTGEALRILSARKFSEQGEDLHLGHANCSDSLGNLLIAHGKDLIHRFDILLIEPGLGLLTRHTLVTWNDPEARETEECRTDLLRSRLWVQDHLPTEPP